MAVEFKYQKSGFQGPCIFHFVHQLVANVVCLSFGAGQEVYYKFIRAFLQKTAENEVDERDKTESEHRNSELKVAKKLNGGILDSAAPLLFTSTHSMMISSYEGFLHDS